MHITNGVFPSHTFFFVNTFCRLLNLGQQLDMVFLDFHIAQFVIDWQQNYPIRFNLEIITHRKKSPKKSVQDADSVRLYRSGMNTIFQN